MTKLLQMECYYIIDFPTQFICSFKFVPNLTSLYSQMRIKRYELEKKLYSIHYYFKTVPTQANKIIYNFIEKKFNHSPLILSLIF